MMKEVKLKSSSGIRSEDCLALWETCLLEHLTQNKSDLFNKERDKTEFIDLLSLS